MILSASGWRKVFAEDGDEQSRMGTIGEENRLLCALAAASFAQYMTERQSAAPVIAVGRDSRPTGAEIADSMLRALTGFGITVQYLGIAAAPEIFAYAKTLDGFLYISASHNPIGHNGLKFGLNDGGVLCGSENAKIIASFCKKCAAPDAHTQAQSVLQQADEAHIAAIYRDSPNVKKAALRAYESLMRVIVTGDGDAAAQEAIFSAMQRALKQKPLRIICDMNGSSRAESIDRAFIEACGLGFDAFNERAGEIAHEIIPEPENLMYCAKKMDAAQRAGRTDALLGYMPDCDGDRGNIVYWNERAGRAEPITAQEVFALCVMAETAYSFKQNPDPAVKRAVAVNCPTSLRIDEICRAFGATLCRAEVGEANVVNLARQKREEGYEVRIFGEGSNGGNITYPSAVRDPVATVFALIKLLTIRSEGGEKGLFELWCEKSGQAEKYRPDFTLADIIATLPAYATTGVSEERAALRVQTADKAALKRRFKTIFEREWEAAHTRLREQFGIARYDAAATNGATEILDVTDWGNQNGGLKIRFFDESDSPIAFIWMRPSGTENVFRVLCDVKGRDSQQAERKLLDWERRMIQEADRLSEA